MTLKERLGDLRGLSKSDVLAAIGLASKRSASERILSSLSIFGVGLLVGGAAALLLAPKSGDELREDLGQRIKKLRQEGADQNSANSSLGSMGSIGRDEIRT
jgi:YtxH-like protein